MPDNSITLACDFPMEKSGTVMGSNTLMITNGLPQPIAKAFEKAKLKIHN